MPHSLGADPDHLETTALNLSQFPEVPAWGLAALESAAVSMPAPQGCPKDCPQKALGEGDDVVVPNRHLSYAAKLCCAKMHLEFLKYPCVSPKPELVPGMSGAHGWLST